MQLFINLFSILYFGSYLESIWGTKEFMKFIFIINTCSTLATYFLILFQCLLFNEKCIPIWIYGTWGFSGIIGGFTVAMKQLIPEQEIYLLFFIPIRAKVK